MLAGCADLAVKQSARVDEVRVRIQKHTRQDRTRRTKGSPAHACWQQHQHSKQWHPSKPHTHTVKGPHPPTLGNRQHGINNSYISCAVIWLLT